MARVRFEDHRAHVDAVIAAVRKACDPTALIALHPTAACGPDPAATGAAIGKAAIRMVAGLEGAGRSWFGPIVVPHGSSPVGSARMDLSISVHTAGHPLPDEGSLAAGAFVGWFLERLADPRRRGPLGLGPGRPPDPETYAALTFTDPGPVSEVLLLLSGGASALVIDPPRHVTLQDYRAVVQALLRAGATIQDVNTVRKHIDLLKGGWLIRRLPRVRIKLVVLSDVLGDDLSVIASGPATADPTTYADAISILERFGSINAGPSVTAWLRAGAAGEYPETPKPLEPDFDRGSAVVVGSNATAITAAAATLDGLNVGAVLRESGVQGEARQVGVALARKAIEMASQRLHGAAVWGGETTVTVGSASGKGGRNQELALAAAIEIDGKPGIAIATFATDGVDGPTDAAGAIVTGQSCDQARRLGLDPRAALQNHDSYSLFDALDRAGYPHLIRTGPTGTNVNDLAIALAY